MGYYDQGTYGGGDNPYSQERQSARDRFAQALDKQSASNKDLMQSTADQMNQSKYQQDKQAMGGQGAKGAMMGSAFGPMGALVGGGIGALSGLNSGYAARRAHGESGGDAFLHSITDIPDMLSGILGSASSMPLVGALGKQLGLGNSAPTTPKFSGSIGGGLGGDHMEGVTGLSNASDYAEMNPNSELGLGELSKLDNDPIFGAHGGDDVSTDNSGAGSMDTDTGNMFTDDEDFNLLGG